MSDNSHFGLVREAPGFLVWVKRAARWQVEGGADTQRQAERVARTIIGKRNVILILPRGEAPKEATPELAGGLGRALLGQQQPVGEPAGRLGRVSFLVARGGPARPR